VGVGQLVRRADRGSRGEPRAGRASIIGRKEDTVPLEWLALGYAIASVDYRLSGDAIFPA
jgi:hypothetical protein